MATITQQDQRVLFALIERRIAELEEQVRAFIMLQIREGVQVTPGQGVLYELQNEIMNVKAQRTRMVSATMTQASGRTGEVIAQQSLFDPDDLITKPRIVVPDRRSGFVLDSIKAEMLIRGPIKWLSDMKQGVPPEVARSHTVTAMTGTASNLIFEGGRATSLRLITKTEEIEGYIRVTGGKPCDFCAMLSSRGPVYKSRGSAKGGRFSAADADFKVHNHCACTPVPVFDKQMPRSEWPGRSGEFRDLWDATKAFADEIDVPYADASRQSRAAFRRSYTEYERLRSENWLAQGIGRAAERELRNTARGQVAGFQFAKSTAERFAFSVGRSAYQATGYNFIASPKNAAALRGLSRDFRAALTKELRQEAGRLATIPGVPLSQLSKQFSVLVAADLTRHTGHEAIKIASRHLARHAAKNPTIIRGADAAARTVLSTRVMGAMLHNPKVGYSLVPLIESGARRHVEAAARKTAAFMLREYERTGRFPFGARILTRPELKVAARTFAGMFNKQVSGRFLNSLEGRIRETLVARASIIGRYPDPPRQLIDQHYSRIYGRMAPRQLVALNAYAGAPWYRPLNEALRNGTLMELDAAYLRGDGRLVSAFPIKPSLMARYLDDLARQGAAPRDFMVFRGYGADMYMNYGNDLSGLVLGNGGFTSTSLSKSHANFFASYRRGPILHIGVPQGTRLIHVNQARDVSSSARARRMALEQELILARHSRIHVLENIGGHHYLAEVVQR